TALPAMSPPSTITSGRYATPALRNLRKHISEPWTSVAKKSRVFLAIAISARHQRVAYLAHPPHHVDHTLWIDRVPRVPVDLEARPDDRPVGDRQHVLDRLVLDAGVGEHRNVHRVLGLAEVGHARVHPGGGAGDEQ